MIYNLINFEITLNVVDSQFCFVNDQDSSAHVMALDKIKSQ